MDFHNVNVLTVNPKEDNHYPFYRYPFFKWKLDRDRCSCLRTYVYSKQFALTAVNAFQISSNLTKRSITHQDKYGTIRKATFSVPSRPLAVVYLDVKRIKRF